MHKIKLTTDWLRSLAERKQELEWGAGAWLWSSVPSGAVNIKCQAEKQAQTDKQTHSHSSTHKSYTHWRCKNVSITIQFDNRRTQKPNQPHWAERLHTHTPHTHTVHTHRTANTHNSPKVDYRTTEIRQQFALELKGCHRFELCLATKDVRIILVRYYILLYYYYIIYIILYFFI